MSEKAAATLLNLPLEMVYRVFDELDGTTLFFSVRNVCQLLRVAVGTYDQNALDFTSLSKPDFHRLLRAVSPESVTGLSLSDGAMTPGQIGLFFSLVDLGLFTRLRSLTLAHIEWRDPSSFLEHVTKCSLTSLILHLPSYRYWQHEQIAQRISSIIAQPNLRRLELLLDQHQSSLINEFKWPVPCKLRYLKIKYQSSTRVDEIITASPELETLVLENEESDLFRPFHHLGQGLLSTPFPRLTSLTLLNCSLHMDAVHSLLSQVPYLRHFKLVTYPFYMMETFGWEELIKTKLLFLNKFEFYTRFFYDQSMGKTGKCPPNELIALFKTPFWTEEKRWLVVCNFFSTSTEAEIYTSPICMSSYAHVSDPRTITISNFEKEDQHSPMLESVEELSVDLRSILVSQLNHSTKLL